MTRRERLFWIGVYLLVAGFTLKLLPSGVVFQAALLLIDGLVLGTLIERARVARRIRQTTQLSERWLEEFRDRQRDTRP